MNRPSTGVSLKDVLNKHKDEIMMETNCHAIGLIEEFNSSEQTCTVKINYLKTRLVRNQSGEYVETSYEYPLLLECPTIIYNGGGAGITMPISQGDSCLVLFNDRDIDNWFSGSNGAPLATSRKHSLSDGVVLVGLNNKSSLIQNYDTDNVNIYNGDSSIKIKTDKIVIDNGTDQLGALLRELVDGVKSIVTTNGGSVNPASQSTLEATMVKIEGLLE